MNEIQNSKPNGLTRREMLKAVGITSIGVAALGATSMSLSGCSGGVYDYEKEYLPIGSVVTIAADADAGLMWMIVARRPELSKMIDYGTGETVNLKEQGTVKDYAGVLYPFGLVSDMSEHAYIGEYTFFDRAHIREVLFVGYQSDKETIAKTALDEAYGSSKTAPEILEMQVKEDLKNRVDLATSQATEEQNEGGEE